MHLFHFSNHDHSCIRSAADGRPVIEGILLHCGPNSCRVSECDLFLAGKARSWQPRLLSDHRSRRGLALQHKLTPFHDVSCILSWVQVSPLICRRLWRRTMHGRHCTGLDPALVFRGYGWNDSAPNNYHHGTMCFFQNIHAIPGPLT